MSAENNVAAQAGDEQMLLPCPFCGGLAVVQTEFRAYGYRAIECSECGANVGAVDLDRGVAMWNRRASPRATADVERDAARYQFMRNEATGNFLRFCPYGAPDEIDKAIDAAIATTKPGA